MGSQRGEWAPCRQFWQRLRLKLGHDRQGWILPSAKGGGAWMNRHIHCVFWLRSVLHKEQDQMLNLGDVYPRWTSSRITHSGSCVQLSVTVFILSFVFLRTYKQILRTTEQGTDIQEICARYLALPGGSRLGNARCNHLARPGGRGKATWARKCKVGCCSSWISEYVMRYQELNLLPGERRLQQPGGLQQKFDHVSKSQERYFCRKKSACGKTSKTLYHARKTQERSFAEKNACGRREDFKKLIL